MTKPSRPSRADPAVPPAAEPPVSPQPAVPPASPARARAAAALAGFAKTRGARSAAEVERARVAALDRSDGSMRSGSDTGVGLAVQRGLVAVSTDALIPLDPDERRGQAYFGTRAQKVWAPDRLLRGRNPAIEQHQHDAATRFYDDFVIGELGARPNLTRGGPRMDPWNRMPFSEQRYQRRVSWERAVMSVGDQFLGILIWTVLQLPSLDRADIPPTVEAWAKARDPEWTTDRAVGFLAGALESLAQHYSFTRTQHPSAARRKRER